MKKRFDLSGRAFGRLTALTFVGSGRRYAWLCRCKCGIEKEVLTGHLLSGAITNCGCRKRSRNGLSRHPLYRVWSNMMRRCTDPRDKAYPDYGARGIFVAPEWLDPEVFISDMDPRPSGSTLERRDNYGPYSKVNCVWADRTTQANNKRNVPLIEFGGECKSVAQWARQRGIPPETLRSRLKAGVPLPDAFKRRKPGPAVRS